MDSNSISSCQTPFDDFTGALLQSPLRNSPELIPNTTVQISLPWIINNSEEYQRHPTPTTPTPVSPINNHTPDAPINSEQDHSLADDSSENEVDQLNTPELVTEPNQQTIMKTANIYFNPATD